jgi:hypothetical protein
MQQFPQLNKLQDLLHQEVISEADNALEDVLGKEVVVAMVGLVDLVVKVVALKDKNQNSNKR